MMLEFPSTHNNWRLDVVSILAVLGENNIKLNANLINLSWTCLLPRLIPAPQGLLSARMKTLPYEEDGQVFGIHSRNLREGLNYFANILHGTGDQLEPYTTREIFISWNKKSKNTTFRLKTFGFLQWITVGSCLASVGLLSWAIVIRDGVATIGIILMSFAAPFLCIGARWNFSPPRRTSPRSWDPSGDVVFRSRSGNFTVVHCTEDIARCLYFAPDRPIYAVESYIGIGLGGIVGGLTLIVSIILFGNCSWTMQAAISVTYTVLNVLYWFAAVLSIRNPRAAWDFSCFIVEEPKSTPNPTYTKALAQAIRMSRDTGWVEKTKAMPESEAWREWLQEAGDHFDDDSWDAQEALSRLMSRGNGVHTV
jgi:hypothetical protein